MSRLKNKKVEVICEWGRPCRVCWEGRWFLVSRIMEAWRDTGEWWRGETEKVFYRLMLSGGGLVEICRVGEEWLFYKAYD